MEIVIYVVVALLVGVVVGKRLPRPRVLVSVPVNPQHPSKEIGNTCVSKDGRDTVKWSATSPDAIGLPTFLAAIPPGSPNPYLNPSAPSQQVVNSGALNTNAVVCSIHPYTMPSSGGVLNGRIIIQK